MSVKAICLFVSCFKLYITIYHHASISTFLGGYLSTCSTVCI